MEALRQYILSVVTAAMLCGIVTGLFPSGAGKQMVRLICGLFLAYTVLAPISRGKLPGLTDFSLGIPEEAAQAAAVGENLASDSMAEIIKSEAEAYILDKARSLQAEVTVEVSVNEENVPNSVTVSGAVSPYVRRQLQRILESDLGIAKENQKWTG